MDVTNFQHVLGWLSFALVTPTGLVLLFYIPAKIRVMEDQEKRGKALRRQRMIGAFLVLFGLVGLL